ncbi:MAG: hypothetical protein ACK42G_04925, partial [Candidatus Kapaibacteriota bacterium]
YHTNIVNKILNRKTAGMFSKEIIITIGNENAELVLNNFLNEYDFFLTLYELYRASKFFNTVMLFANVIDNKIIFEILNGSESIVKPKENFYDINEIGIMRIDKDNQVYILTINENEIYRLYGNEIVPVFETIENPFGLIPISVYRDKKGNDFWGEPNWQLYYAQLFAVLSKSDTVQGELMQKFPILFGENVDIEKLVLSPSVAVSVSNFRPDVKVDLRYITPSVDWAQLRDNDKYFKEDIAINEGLPASSTSLQAIQQSGYAKTIDEIELREQQMLDEWKLYSFVKDFIPKLLIVADYFNLIDNDIRKIISNDYYVDVKFNPSKIYEEPSQIKTRREMEKQFLIKDEIDFIIEDLGLTEQEAIDYLKKRLERADLINELKAKLEQETTDETEIPLIERLKSLM